jgi:hypothetical protein
MSAMIAGVEKIRIWAARGDGGETGGSTAPIVGYCRTEAQAKDLAKGKGFYGSQGHVSQHDALEVNGEIWVLAASNPVDLDNAQARRDDDLRKRTLASLSDEQRRVLGLLPAD